MMRLYSADLSPYSARVRMQIYAKGITDISGGRVRLDRISSRISGFSAGCDMSIWARSAGRA